MRYGSPTLGPVGDHPTRPPCPRVWSRSPNR